MPRDLNRQARTMRLRRLNESADQRHLRLTAQNRQQNQRREPLHSWRVKLNTGFSYTVQINYAEFANVGRMMDICPHCKAMKWHAESKGLCCSAGKVKLQTLQEPPEPLKSLLLGEHSLSNDFLTSVRAYNSTFQMTSFGGSQIREGNFMPCFKIQGQIYHRIGSLLPVENSASKFLQIYFISDYMDQANARVANFPNLDRIIVVELQHLLHENNVYVQNFKTALQSIPSNERDNYKIVIKADQRPLNEHSGRFNTPTTNEVAVLLINESVGNRDIVLRTRDNQLKRICATHRAYDTLQYPLIFCYGEDGYNFNIPLVNPLNGEETNKKISALQFYSYRIMVRRDDLNYLMHFRQLLNQFLVDMYAKIESERMLYIRTNQNKLRAESYIHLKDAILHDGDPDNLGQLVILPSSFTGGPRYMHQRTQDALVYVRKYGRPDLFITITTNPNWEEIRNELFQGQASYDRHDLITRVFHLKLKKIIDLFTKEKVFGTVKCYMFTVEWQKRGLPHAHILLWMDNKITPNQIDSLICAEFPSEELDPELYEIVKSHMVHGPCGELNINSPCMKEGRCSKKYPKQFTIATITGDDGYPTYRRRSPHDGGLTAFKMIHGQRVSVDNRWVVPYSPVLLRTFKTHINVEYCGSISAIKYICKYVNKGSDQATISIQNKRDEVMSYQSGRYISTSEAAWRILSLPIHERFPSVLHLDVHLENGQRVYFTAANVHRQIENPKNTTLTAFFQLCIQDSFAKTLLYEQVPSYYTFDKQRGVFNRRRRGAPVAEYQGVFKDNTIGRVYTVHPNNTECFFLRLLLHNVRGPTSFASIRNVEGRDHATFQAACAALSLLEDDRHWDQALEEASNYQSGKLLRELFATILVFCNLLNANELWLKYAQHFCDDLQHNLRSQSSSNCCEVQNVCLLKIQQLVLSIGGQQLCHYGLPTPNVTNDIAVNSEYAVETNYNRDDLTNFVQLNEPRLTLDQKAIYEEVIDSGNNHLGKILFLDAPGGTGKTFLLKLMLNRVRKDGHIALAVASSGIAATLLPGGKTAHSCFKIPLNLSSENPICSVSRNSNKAAVFKDCMLIVWDECTMAYKTALEAVDRTLRDIRDNNQIMGGVTFVLSGDFRQTLPVVPRGTRADEINASIKKSNLWPFIKKFSLKQNMRVVLGGDPQVQQFSNILLSIGEGTMPEIDKEINLLPSLCTVVPNIKELINSVYPDIVNLHTKEDSWLCERSILASKNDEVLAINNVIMEMFEAQSWTYIALNSVVDQSEATNFPTEFLNSLMVSGLPAHEIKLKVGAPIILMRNLRSPKLCNGTRLRVKKLLRNLIEATILTGCGRGESVLIPRIPLIPLNFPFQFKRLQFPVAVCFAMTINKSQGQTLRSVGINLRTPCFSHGQLYVAVSRVSRPSHLFIYAPNNKTKNVVYKEILC